MDRPLIIVGRGGSGTRLAAEIARGCGIFLGNQLNVSSDSVEWVDPIYSLAVQSLTGSLAEAGAVERLRHRAADILARGGIGPNGLWGWKLPETILCLPLVLRAFPKARIVHLVRHPLSSALRRTHKTSRPDDEIGRFVLDAAYRAHGLDPAAMAADPEWFHNAVTYAFQVGGAADMLAKLPPDRVLVLRYEDVCASPAGAARRVATLLGQDLPFDPAAMTIDPARFGTTEGDPETVARIWSLCGGLAARLGYGLTSQDAWGGISPK